MSSLVLRDITKSFDGHSVLKGLSVEIPLRGLTFIVGASGSGKSVLCRLAVGLLKPDSGTVSLLGRTVNELPERELRAVRAQVPYLVQGAALLDWLTLEENVALANREAPPGAARTSLARVGLEAFASRQPPQVGPGIRKRTAIARALMLQPTFLLLDEPTTGLDRDAAGQVNDTLRQLRDEGLGAALVSHDYRALDALADLVVEVHNGVTRYVGDRAGFLASTPAGAV